MSGLTREKFPKLVITFSTTTAAMAMEATCEPEYGRLIPIPSEMSGGCGFAWCAEPEYEKRLLQLMEQNHIFYQEKRIILLYI